MRFMLKGSEKISWFERNDTAGLVKKMNDDQLNDLSQRLNIFLVLIGMEDTENKMPLNFRFAYKEQGSSRDISKDEFLSLFISFLKEIVLKYDLNPTWLFHNTGTYLNTLNNIFDIMQYLLSFPVLELVLIGNRIETVLKDLKISVKELSTALNIEKETIYSILKGNCIDVDVVMYLLIFLQIRHNINIDFLLSGTCKKFLPKDSKKSIENVILEKIFNASRYHFHNNDKVFYIDEINILKGILIMRDQSMNFFECKEPTTHPRLRVNLKAVKPVFRERFFNLFNVLK